MAKSPSRRGDRQRWRVAPGKPVDLARIDTSSTAGVPGDKAETEAALPALWDQLGELQERLYAESKRSLLVVLQAMDAGGKDGTIKNVFRGTNPQGVRVASFKAPTEEELAHDFLWRIHSQVPRHGEIGVFNRSHYEDVLVVRVHDLVPKAVWKERYSLIRHFERALIAGGTTVVKLYLHISEDEQAERLQARVDDETKHWKFRIGDLAERERWDDYRAAFEDAIAETSTADAPWYVVPADRKWYRNWAVLRILVETLQAMDPQFPPPEDDIASVVVD
jgi:PPK2 family polyphosphate:nucleotide phosphotransferase